MCLTRHRDVGATLLGTAFGTSWNDLTEKWKCGTEAEETDECQFPVCWDGEATLGKWVVGAPSGFKVANMHALRDRMYWWERDGLTNRLCLGGAGATNATCANQKCSDVLDRKDSTGAPYF